MEIDGSETPWTHLILPNYVLKHVICILPRVFLTGGKIQMEEIFTSWWSYQICWNLEIISVINKQTNKSGVYKETLWGHKVSELYSACTRNQQRAGGQGPGDGHGEGFSSCASVGKGPAWQSACTLAGLGLALWQPRRYEGALGKSQHMSLSTV